MKTHEEMKKIYLRLAADLAFGESIRADDLRPDDEAATHELPETPPDPVSGAGERI